MRKNPAAFYVMGEDLLWQMSGTNCKLDLKRFHLHVGVLVGKAEQLIKDIHISNRSASAEESAAMRILNIEASPIIMELLGTSSNTHHVNHLFGPVDVKVPQKFPLEAFRPPGADWKVWIKAVGLFLSWQLTTPTLEDLRMAS